jgi:hypothetical protein
MDLFLAIGLFLGKQTTMEFNTAAQEGESIMRTAPTSAYFRQTEQSRRRLPWETRCASLR